MKFNENEITVIKALVTAVQDATGDEFGFMDEVERPEGMSKHQFAGYVSDLKAKGVFQDFEEIQTDSWKGIQFTLTPAIWKQFA